MCGIVGYIGKENSVEKIISGLSRLEYRGYDSAGIAFVKGNNLSVVKSVGRVGSLSEKVKSVFADMNSASIGHTRWATHGAVTEENAHPQVSGKVTLVHNGIIENFNELKKKLIRDGESFTSSTDTEVLAKLIDVNYRVTNDKTASIVNAIKEIEGTFAIGLIFEDEKNAIYAFCKASPLILGKGGDGNYIFSDQYAFDECEKIFRIPENTVLKITCDKVSLKDFDGNEINIAWSEINAQTISDGVGEFSSYMEKEINDEPMAIQNAIKGLIVDGMPDFANAGIDIKKIINAKRLYIVCCGSAMHAGFLAKPFFERLAGIEVTVVIASEFRYMKPIINNGDVAVFVSQSGETADTIASLEYAKGQGMYTIGIVNAENTTIAEKCDAVALCHAGREISVATTKGYSTQFAILYLLSLGLAYEKGLIPRDFVENEISVLKNNVSQIVINTISRKEEMQGISETIAKSEHMFYIGRGIDYYLSMEASLKLKEISMIHSEAIAAGELKHGTISLITKGMPVIALCADSTLLSKTKSNAIEVMSRGGEVFVFAESKEKDSFSGMDFVPLFGKTLIERVFECIVFVQLIALETTKIKGYDIDKPRNLAKSVTVE